MHGDNVNVFGTIFVPKLGKLSFSEAVDLNDLLDLRHVDRGGCVDGGAGLRQLDPDWATPVAAAGAAAEVRAGAGS